MRGETKHYSNLTVKLGVAEAEIRSVTARKMQLAVKLAQVEREKEHALQVGTSGCPNGHDLNHARSIQLPTREWRS